MTLIRERCVEKACSRLSAKKHQLPVRGGLGEVGSVSPSGSRRRFGNEPWEWVAFAAWALALAWK
jgi:hypothetical protein